MTNKTKNKTKDEKGMDNRPSALRKGFSPVFLAHHVVC